MDAQVTARIKKIFFKGQTPILSPYGVHLKNVFKLTKMFQNKILDFKINTQPWALISTQKMSHMYNNKDLSHLACK